MCVCVCVCVYHIFLIYLSIVGHLGCFHSLAIVNSALINIGMPVSLLYLDLTFIVVCVLDNGHAKRNEIES
jgi:hypothetical protein